MEAAARRPRIFPASPLRIERLRRGVVLSEVARASGLSHARVSVLERDPSLAKPGEIEQLRRGLEHAAEASGRP